MGGPSRSDSELMAVRPGLIDPWSSLALRVGKMRTNWFLNRPRGERITDHVPPSLSASAPLACASLRLASPRLRKA